MPQDVPVSESRSSLTANTVFSAPIDVAPVTTVACHLLAKSSSLGIPSNSCVVTCLLIRHALACYRIASHLEAVTVCIQVGTATKKYGPGNGPWYQGSRFKGHAVLVVPSIGMFLDPTIGQFPEVRAAGLKELPFLGRLPIKGSNLGTEPFGLPRKGHILAYIPYPNARNAWRHPSLYTSKVVASFAQLGEDIASEVFDMFRQYRPEIIQKSPHARLHELAEALAGARLVTDVEHGSRFLHASGSETRLREVP